MFDPYGVRRPMAGPITDWRKFITRAAMPARRARSNLTSPKPGSATASCCRFPISDARPPPGDAGAQAGASFAWSSGADVSPAPRLELPSRRRRATGLRRTERTSCRANRGKAAFTNLSWKRPSRCSYPEKHFGLNQIDAPAAWCTRCLLAILLGHSHVRC